MYPLVNSLAVRAADAPAIKPAVELGTPLLLTIAVAGVALLLLMIIRFKIQAFVALLTVSILVAVAAQIPLKDVFTVVANGVGGTMGKVALLIALGAVLGRMIEVSGGVQSLANHRPGRGGRRRGVRPGRHPAGGAQDGQHPQWPAAHHSAACAGRRRQRAGLVAAGPCLGPGGHP
jgi:GntP family gluconate:H+ symporter